MLAGFPGRIYNGAAIEQEQETQGRQGLSGGWDAQIDPQAQANSAAGFVGQTLRATAHVALGCNTMRVALLVAAICLVAAPALAGVESYVCSVSSVRQLKDDGALASDSSAPVNGLEFAVDRTSGKMIGKYIGSNGYKTTVLDAGSNQQSFKMLGTNSLGYKHVLYLQIEEFRAASRKPFFLIDGSLIYAGTCE